MNLKILCVLLIIGVLCSCQNFSSNQKNVSPQIRKKEFTKKEFYEAKMEEKNFSLIPNGPCDDALEDTLHQRNTAYIDSEIITDSTAIIEFKFKNACCQEFLGDFQIIKDSLKFEFEQVNDVMCACICWYRYKLVINNIEEKINKIEIGGI